MLIRIILTLLFLWIAVIYGQLFAQKSPETTKSRYTKVTQKGESISPWAGPWQCVLDQETGLLWEVKTDSETIHDAYWSYSWFIEQDGIENFGDCYFKKDRCDTSDLIEHVNQQGLCQRKNWRLPTLKELQTLVYQQHKPGYQTIDLGFFPNTKAGDYWTVSNQPQLEGAFRHLREGAYVVNFKTGESQALPYRNAAFVRLVSSDE